MTKLERVVLETLEQVCTYIGGELMGRGYKDNWASDKMEVMTALLAEQDEPEQQAEGWVSESRYSALQAELGAMTERNNCNAALAAEAEEKLSELLRLVGEYGKVRGYVIGGEPSRKWNHLKRYAESLQGGEQDG